MVVEVQIASSIPESKPVINIPALAQAEVGGRVCATAVPGFAAVREIFTWMVPSLGPQTSMVESRAEVDMPLFSRMAHV
jgi:hypothetical protein